MANETGTKDTSGVTGNPGPVPIGTQQNAHVKDTTVDGDAPRFGGGPFADPAPATNPDTSSGSGYSLTHLADYSQVQVGIAQVSTDYTGTLETVMPGMHHVDREYSGLDPYVPGTIVDTSWTDVAGVGHHIDDEDPLQYYYLTPDTYNIAAGAPGELGTESVTLADAGTALTTYGIFQGSLVVKTDGGQTETRTETFNISAEGTQLGGRGFVSAEVSAIVNGNEDVVLTADEQPVALAQTGIVSELEDIVVTFESATLTAGDDYVLSDNGETGSSRIVSIAWVSGGALPLGTETVNVAYEHTQALTEGTDYDLTEEGSQANSVATITYNNTSALIEAGDEVSVTYLVGGYGYFFPQRLVEGVDFRSERTYQSGNLVTTLYPVEGSTRAVDGDDVTVTYLHGSLGTYNARVPATVPNAPSGVVAFARDRHVEVQWDHPVGGASYDGFLIEESTRHTIEVSTNDGVEGAPLEERTISASGLLYVSAHESNARLFYLEADRQFNEHDPGHEDVFGTSEDYVFRVAAVNHNGVGEYTAWTTPSTAPANYDLNPPAGVHPRNRVNPVYRADGTIVPGTGLGR